MIPDQEMKLAEQVISLHDGKHFNLLQEMSMPSPDDESDGTITEEGYIAKCEEIREELGELSSIEFINSLERSDSRLTLWKAKYDSSENEVCWAIGFDSKTHQVKDVIVTW
ncbi:hypothetical protein [Nitrincola iocasae]|uniref:Uncharacterized protein n=1 Tax=Nitrincola iocasae TaxID=2614693 RepID=A0A5J6LEI4_9GAMM|nr:hypothetical protein [Nitrincola iocasae]QEW06716.1 hypothetical protein F5I99_09480 [Nitrincola iocasae]